MPQPQLLNTKTMEWDTVFIQYPEQAVNVASLANGAVAACSSSSGGFSPAGAINGNRTVSGWGKGNGWQSAPVSWHPNWWGEWLEIRFAAAAPIDTIVVYSFPAFVKGRFWRGLSDFQVQVERPGGLWETVETARDNQEDTRDIRFPLLETFAIRIWVTKNHYPEETGFESGSISPSEAPRILEVEAYRLDGTSLRKTEKRTKTIETGPKGNAAIFYDTTFSSLLTAEPTAFIHELRARGYGVTLLTADDLCSPACFQAQNFDLLVHPYGEDIPVGSNLMDFLKDGGHLLALGGRSFTSAKQKDGGVWHDTGMDPEITVSAGRYRDYVRPYRDQLGIFSIPHSELNFVESVTLAQEQRIFTEPVTLEGPFTGWMACGTVGELLPIDESARYMQQGRLHEISHMSRAGMHYAKHDVPLLWGDGLDENYGSVFAHPCARWIPLLMGHDRYGRDRGAVGALMMHYEGVYRGSHWAFFGADNVNLLEQAALLPALGKAIDFMFEGITIHSLEPEYSCYREGEAVSFDLWVDHCGKSSNRSAEIEIVVHPAGDPNTILHRERHSITLEQGGQKRISGNWTPPALHHDLYVVKGSLKLDGKLVDEIENGFVAWKEESWEQVTRAEYHDNYFHFNGVPRYVTGARDSGLHLPGAPDENPLGWDGQYRMMRDFGMMVTSPVHFDWHVPGLGWGVLDEKQPVPEVVLRRLDAQAFLAQKYNLIYAPTLFFNHEKIALNRHEVSAAICRQIGHRYKNVPNMIIYLFDDGLRHEPDVFNAWAKTCVDALRESGREYMVTAEFGFRQIWPDTMRHSAKHLTFTSGSAFQQSVGDPVYEKIVDMRPVGKSFTVGEFVRRIPSGSEEDVHGYLAPPHMNFGTGHAMSLNWKWRTGYHTIWPSDVVFPGHWIPKSHLYTFRNEAFLFRQFRPHYRTPELLVVLPSDTWLKNSEPVTKYLVQMLRRLIELKIDYSCIDDVDLSLLPEDCKALIYPLAFETKEETVAHLEAFVNRGGMVFLTGELAAPDELSTVRLCGVRTKPAFASPMVKGRSYYMERYLPELHAIPVIADSGIEAYQARPWAFVENVDAESLVADGEGRPIVTRHSLGEGTVWFTPDMNAKLPGSLLTAFTDEAGVRRHRVSPEEPTLHCFEVYTDLGSVYTVSTFPWDQGVRQMRIDTASGGVELTLQNQAIGLVHVLSSGGVQAVETQGPVRWNDEVIVDTNAHLMLFSLDETHLPGSSAVLLMPVSPGQTKIRTNHIDRMEIGELAGGRWKAYESTPVDISEGFLTVETDAFTRTMLVLLYSAEQRENAVSAAERTLAGQPDPDHSYGE